MTKTNTNTATIGLKAKTGRAIAIVLSGPSETPRLVKRTELNFIDPQNPTTFQPFHSVMDLPWNESAKRVAPLIEVIESIAAKALAEIIRELQAEGLKVVGVGIVGSADRDVGKIGNYHIRAHAAEGLLFRQVLESAAETNKVPYRSYIEKTLLAQAADELGLTVNQLNNRLKNIGDSAGPPWRSDQRVAAAAAWIVFCHHKESAGKK